MEPGSAWMLALTITSVWFYNRREHHANNLPQFRLDLTNC